MRRVSIVSFIPVLPTLAAAVVIGHVVPHLMAPRYRPPEAHATTLASAAGVATPPLIAPTCRLQPPLTEADRRPTLVALRLRYPHYFGAGHRDLYGHFQTCGVDPLRASSPFARTALP